MELLVHTCDGEACFGATAEGMRWTGQREAQASAQGTVGTGREEPRRKPREQEPKAGFGGGGDELFPQLGA